jgi:hypothetical protein
MDAVRSPSRSKSWTESRRMSLIEVWRDRRRGSVGPTKPPRLWKLLASLAIVGYMIWYLSRLT